jgi:hypothetical protein
MRHAGVAEDEVKKEKGAKEAKAKASPAKGKGKGARSKFSVVQDTPYVLSCEASCETRLSQDAPEHIPQAQSRAKT